MTIKLKYTNDKGDDFNINVQILHPHFFLETWIVLTNPTLTDHSNRDHAVDISQIDLKQILEKVYNFFIPGLRVLSTKIYFIDTQGDYRIQIKYDGHGIFNTQAIYIYDYSFIETEPSDYRIRHLKELLSKISN